MKKNFPRKVLVILPWYAQHDAISNDAYWQVQYLRATGMESYLYAEACQEKLRDRLISYQDALTLLLDRQSIVIYHHGVYWAQGEQLLRQTSAFKIMKYHNITPPEFYRKYDRISTFATERGRQQTGDFLRNESFGLILGDSQYNLDDLRSYDVNLPRMDVLAPFTQISDFDSVEADAEVLGNLRDSQRLNLLFVGRVVPNKGFLHMLEVLRTYIQFYGTSIKLNIIGALGLAEDDYFIEIEQLVKKYKLSNHIEFHSSVSFASIKAYYQASDIFLLLSEHEGFCVPVLESQYLSLPLLALDRAAVAETAGEGALVSSGLDYSYFASAIWVLQNKPELKETLQRKGLENYRRFKPELLTQKLLEIMEAL